ncbi:transcriptional regulator [Aquabacterium fontiphilum]|jgi:DNA-binding HxlR family transcriptional regulator|uniref:winged helix-turn-helix transcriptional regulator n=1 Tax=Aquabacterium fontiphilum TaxID=450365 RepID=UPI0013781B5C|nr:helix-turn-helix domain-containing protein [Aquabacterium fontiphilum]NBD20340.1 transcriptional regulator [Aquabacterium fontiphilum]
MTRSSFAHMRCSIARSLDVIGEWWTLLIVREAFWGARRFGEFEARLGIAPNILSQRLGRLVAHGVLEVTQTSQNGKAMAYALTDKGRDLLPVLVALTQWGDQHEALPDGPAVTLVDRATGQPLGPLRLSTRDGQPVAPRNVTVLPGPGALDDERERLEALQARRAARLAAAQAGASSDPTP